jgi:hypothetical protein
VDLLLHLDGLAAVGVGQLGLLLLGGGEAPAVRVEVLHVRVALVRLAL